MNKKIGFIGCGNMGQAMIGGIIKSKLSTPENVIAADPNDFKLEAIKKEFNINITKDAIEASKFCDILILAVKPNSFSNLITDINSTITSSKIVVSIAAGISIGYLENALGNDKKIVRVMPNTPALVGEGMSALCKNINVSAEEMEEVIHIFESFGKAEIIDEKLMDSIPAISGSSPAYVFMFIEALADGAVLRGMPRQKAYKFAAQAVLGAAKMVLETGEHPGSLKDKVCSPGGTTIDAVYSLEKNNFRGTVIDAMESCTKKAIEMSNENKK